MRIKRVISQIYLSMHFMQGGVIKKFLKDQEKITVLLTMLLTFEWFEHLDFNRQYRQLRHFSLNIRNPVRLDTCINSFSAGRKKPIFIAALCCRL